MGRTAGQFCSRESAYRLQTDSIPLETSRPEDIVEQPDREAMTWQQQKDFGPAVKANERKSKSKAVRWTPFDSDAVEDPPVTQTIGNDDAQLPQQAEVPIVNHRRQAPGKAVGSPLRTSSTPASIEPPHDDIAPKSDAAKKQRSNRRKTSPQKLNGNVKEKMSTATKSIPPHLRKKTAALSAVAAAPIAEKVESSATNGSTATSEKSKPGQDAKLHSSTNGASHPLTPPPSLPTTPREPEFKKVGKSHTSEAELPQPANEPTDTVLGGWDDPKPDPPPAAPRASNPRWPRTGGGGGFKKTVWPKQSEMRAMPSSSSSDGGVRCPSNSDGDPDYDVKKLTDWNGNWMAPPEDWAARKGHTSRHFGNGIEQWIDGHSEECTEAMTYEPSAFLEGGCKELVPRYWLYTTIESKPAADFWKSMPTREPAALSDIDVFADPPFWERYENNGSCFIDALAVSDDRVDPEDVDNHHPHADLLASADDRVKVIQERKTRNQRRTHLKQTRPVREVKPMMPPMEDRRIKPKSNVYFRPVKPTDVQGITDIYNYYVEQTIFANEFDRRTVSQISERIDDIVRNGLPYLVGVARGNQQRAQGYVSEKIVGYACLEDFCGRSSMYRFTFELELYVHPGYQSQNIASCLLDRLLEMANTGYNACGGYEYRNDSEYLKNGPSRVIKTILLNVLKEQGEDAQKTTDFLKKFKFRCAGHIKEMGFKLGKIVDVYHYQHNTSEVIDPSSKPTGAPGGV